MYLNIEGGKKIAMPRYLKNKIYNREQKSEISGWWKGEMERRNDEFHTIISSGKSVHVYQEERYHLDKHYAYVQEFERMHKKALLNRDKI